jgi:hypothetical protein
LRTPVITAHWRRVALAAARLGAFYAVGVVVLLLSVSLFLGDIPHSLSELAILSVPFAVLFLVAFTILAIARRVGFALLWALLIGLWAWMLLQPTFYPKIVLVRFIGWTLLALPLYALGMVGLPPSRRIPILKWRAHPAWPVLAIWLALIAAAIHYSRFATDVGPLPTHFRIVLALAPVLWGTTPFLIAGSELLRVWLAFGKLDHAPAA